jgi:hypothetical protein
MKNVFIAIGGSGTKVAEALVGLLALGFPTKSQGGLTSVGDELEIWRVDSDQAAGADDALGRRLETTRHLQTALESGWCMEIKPSVKDLNPLQINDGGRELKTLKDVLNSADDEETQKFLDLFYTEAEQQEDISRGFYQKPFIGSAVMAVYADTLPRRAAALGLQLASLTTAPARFFICGSLHGGTGASGVSVLGKFLADQAEKVSNDNWEIYACLLAPYSDPPEPFIDEADARALTTREAVLAWFKRPENQRHTNELQLSDDEKVEAVFQIGRGFYAKNKELSPRSQHNLKYYRDNRYMRHFKHVYVVGKNRRDTLPRWSNGGKKQNNPMNSAEIVAALSALHCFSGGGNMQGTGDYVVATSTDGGASPIDEQGMGLYHLPVYSVGGTEIDPEKVVLATVAASLLIAYDHLWPTNGKNDEWPGDRKLGEVYRRTPGRKADDGAAFVAAANHIREISRSLLGQGRLESLGWRTEVWSGVSQNLPTEPKVADDLLETFTVPKWKFWGELNSPRIGQCKWKVDFAKFRGWALPEQQTFNRGAYFRFVWSKIYDTIEPC